MARDTTQTHFFSHLRDFFEELDGERVKAASATKKADDGIADPGGYDGKSTHPSADRSLVRDQLRPEQTGSRFSENTSDVKDDIGSASIQNLPEEASSPAKGSGNQDKRQPNVGMTSRATGEDTSVERDFKGDKDDPGTSSVMKADDGEKYGAWIKAAASRVASLGEMVLADIANNKLAVVKAAGIGDDVPNGTRPVANGQAPPAAKADEEKKPDTPLERAKEAAQRGYEFAAALGNGGDDAAMVETIIKEAMFQADLTADFIRSYDRTIKQAAGEHPDGGTGEDHSQPGDASGMGGGMGGMGGGGQGGGQGGEEDPMQVLGSLPPEVLQQLVQAYESGQLGDAGGMPGGQGGLSGGGAEMTGGDMGGQGGAGGGMGGGMGGGGMGGAQGAQGALAGMMGGGGGPPADPSQAAGPGGEGPAALNDDQTNDQLTGAMQDMDISPEQLEGMAGKAAAHERQTLLKIASRVRQHRRAGKYDGSKQASSPAEQRLRSMAREYLAETLRPVM